MHAESLVARCIHECGLQHPSGQRGRTHLYLNAMQSCSPAPPSEQIPLYVHMLLHLYFLIMQDSVLSSSADASLLLHVDANVMTTCAVQIPTQSFFTNDFGMPLTMNPNFEDLSCDMIFGQTPPPLEQDPVYTQACFVPQCSLAASVETCPKTDTERVTSRRRAAAVTAASSSTSINSSV